MTSKYSLLLILLSVQLLAHGQQKKTDVSVAKFYGNRPAAICYGFDDGLKDQQEIAVPLLEKYGFKATFFIIPGVVAANDEEALKLKEGAWGGITWPKLQQMAANGHEISSHSLMHKDMRKLSDAELQQEIDKADKLIFEKIGRRPVTFAYPYNAFDDQVHQAVLKNHIASRDFQFGIGARFTTQQGNSWADELIKNEKWGITMIHGIIQGFDPPANPQLLDDHFKYVKALKDKIWVSTFANISKYVQERDSSTLNVKYKKSSISINLSGKLNTEMYDQPLTIIIAVSNAHHAEAKQADKTLPVKVLKDKILVDIIPGASRVDVKWE